MTHRYTRASEYKRKGVQGRVMVIILLLVLCIFIIFGFRRYYFCNAIDVMWLRNLPIAHRGLYIDRYGDNSIESFQQAISAGYAIEFDLRFTKDNVPMVIHDNNLKSATGVAAKLSDILYADAKHLTVAVTGKPIPSFEEALALVHGQVPLLIEIKSYHIPNEFEANIIRILDNYDGEYAIQSYSPLACHYIKKRRPNIVVGLLLNDPTPKTPAFVRKMKDNLFTLICSPNFIAYNYELIDQGIIETYRPNDLILLGFVLSEQSIHTRDYVDKVDNIIFEAS